MSAAYAISLNGTPKEVVLGLRETVEEYLQECMEEYWRETGQFIYCNREVYSAQCKWAILPINLKVLP